MTSVGYSSSEFWLGCQLGIAPDALSARIAGRQSSGAPLAFFGGDIQIAWIGPW